MFFVRRQLQCDQQHLKGVFARLANTPLEVANCPGAESCALCQLLLGQAGSTAVTLEQSSEGR